MKSLRTSIRMTALSAAMVLGLAMLQAPSISAQTQGTTNGCNDISFLTLPAWYRGLTDGNCDIVSPTEVGGIGPFIWAIALNVVEILLRLAGYAAVAFIIYGGFKYMTSVGSPDGMVSARKTILNAVVGLVISVVAIAIIRMVTRGLGVG